jgi:hypothetical protein
MLHMIAGALLALAGLVLPGLAWAPAGTGAARLATGCLLSWLFLLLGILVFSWLGLPVTLGTLGGLQLVLGLLGWWWRQRGRAAAAPEPNRIWWPWLFVLPLGAVAVHSALFTPLPGPDVVFRWNALARLIAHGQGLSPYPPFTSADFARYFWCESICPQVPGLLAWTYLAVGSDAVCWSALPVLLQGLVLLLVLHGLGRELGGGPLAAGLAVAAGAGCFLLQFAANLGQESAVLAAACGAMMLHLLRWDREGGKGVPVAAALCGAVAACCREYAPALSFVAGLWILLDRRRPLGGLGFLGLALLPAGLWSLRTLLLTGNPLYSLDLAGLFTVNPVFAAYQRETLALYGGLSWVHPFGSSLLRYLLIGCLPALAGLAWGLLAQRGRPGHRLVLLLALACAACWHASVPYTSGGLFYTLRVLAPALLVGCALAGALLAGLWPRLGLRLLLLAGLTVATLDASLRAWTLPLNPHQLSWRDWAGASQSFASRDVAPQNPLFLRLLAPGVGKVLSDSPALTDEVQQTGRLMPLWTPELAFLFQRGACSPAEAGARLKALGYTHVLRQRQGVPVAFWAHSGAEGLLAGGLRPVDQNEGFVLLEIP